MRRCSSTISRSARRRITTQEATASSEAAVSPAFEPRSTRSPFGLIGLRTKHCRGPARTSSTRCRSAPVLTAPKCACPRRRSSGTAPKPAFTAKTRPPAVLGAMRNECGPATSTETASRGRDPCALDSLRTRTVPSGRIDRPRGGTSLHPAHGNLPAIAQVQETCDGARTTGLRDGDGRADHRTLICGHHARSRLLGLRIERSRAAREIYQPTHTSTGVLRTARNGCSQRALLAPLGGCGVASAGSSGSSSVDR